MSENTELSPVGEIAQQPVAAAPEVLAELERLKAHNQELLAEKVSYRENSEGKFKEMEKQIRDLHSSQSKAKQAKLQEEGRFEPLWKEANDTNAALSTENEQLKQLLEQERKSREAETVKAKAISAFQQAGVVQPEDMYALHQERLRLNGDQLVALDGGVETDLPRFIDGMKQPGSRWEYMFGSSGARGMGASGSTPSSTGGKSFDEMSFSEKIALEMQDKEAFLRLKAQSGKA